MKNSVLFCASFTLLFLTSCNQKVEKEVVQKKASLVRTAPKSVTYRLESSKIWLEQNGSNQQQLEIVLTANRVDKANLIKMDSIIVPTDVSGDVVFYQPFPLEVPYLEDVNKIIFFSYPTQTFAAYENGVLMASGPTSMGRKKDPTPTGLFFTNWKAEETKSTFNDEWELKWNFNVENKLGIGFHEYELPGYPASHSCLRLLEKDAKYLYNWADQWVVTKSENSVKVKGTPVIVFGSYPFGSPKPWLQLISNPKALGISEIELETQTSPFMQKIVAAQKVKSDHEAAK